MKLTKHGDYGVRVLAYLAARPSAQIKEIAERQHIPQAYLAKVVQDLSRSGLIRTSRGPRGGIRLSRPPGEVTLREAIEAAQGPIVFNRCLLWEGECPRGGTCPTHGAWKRVQNAIRRELESITLADLAAGQEIEEQRGSDE